MVAGANRNFPFSAQRFDYVYARLCGRPFYLHALLDNGKQRCVLSIPDFLSSRFLLV